MLTIELINNNIPRLQLQDTVTKALRLINDFRVTHLPVVSDNTFLGLISEEDLLDAKEVKMPIELMQETFVYAAVRDNEHFLTAVNCSNQFDTTVVPVVNEEKEFIGVITTTELLKTLGNFSGTNEIGGIIVLEMRFAASSLFQRSAASLKVMMLLFIISTQLLMPIPACSRLPFTSIKKLQP